MLKMNKKCIVSIAIASIMLMTGCSSVQEISAESVNFEASNSTFYVPQMTNIRVENSTNNLYTVKDNWGRLYPYSYYTVSGDRKELYVRMYNAFYTFNNAVDLTNLSVTQNDIIDIFNLMCLDNSDFYYISREMQILTKKNASEMVELRVKYTYSKTNVETYSSYFDKVAKLLENKLSDDMSEYSKFLAIHDFLVDNIVYNTDATNTVHNSDLIGAFVNRTCQCDGYSKAFIYLSRHMGLMSTVATGYVDSSSIIGGTTAHIWNLAYCNDEWMQVDVTFDDVAYYKKGMNYRLYFGVTQDDLNLLKTYNRIKDGETGYYPSPELSEKEMSFLAKNYNVVNFNDKDSEDGILLYRDISDMLFQAKLHKYPQIVIICDSVTEYSFLRNKVFVASNKVMQKAFYDNGIKSFNVEGDVEHNMLYIKVFF